MFYYINNVVSYLPAVVNIFGTHLSVGGCQLPKERLLYSSDIRRSQFKVMHGFDFDREFLMDRLCQK
jgi:hypothetical protein